MKKSNPKKIYSPRGSAANRWPADMSFKAFKKISPASEEWVTKTVYELRGDQISVQNQKIGLEKLSKILRGTFKLSASHGFKTMSLRELSAECDISMGGLYAYIGSKEELANLIEHVLSAIANDLTDLAMQEAIGSKQKLGALISSHVFLSEQLKPWFYFVFMEAKSLSTKQKEMAKRTEIGFEERVVGIITQGIEEGVFQRVDVTLTASALMALMQDWYLKSWKHRGRKVTPDRYAQFLLDLIMRQLGTVN